MKRLLSFFKSRCIPFHDWTEWKQGTGNYHSDSMRVGTVVQFREKAMMLELRIQARDCKRCKFHQVKKV